MNFVGILSLIQYADHNIDLFESQLLNWVSFFIWEGWFIFQINAEQNLILTSPPPHKILWH